MAETCRSCGASIRWVTNAATGKLIPLDARPVVRYTLSEDEKEATGQKFYASHFETCPNASGHSKKGKA